MAEDNFFDDGNHALVTGDILGALLRCGFEVKPGVDVDGDYLPMIIVNNPSGKWKITVEPA